LRNRNSLKSRNRNRKNSYGSTTLESRPGTGFLAVFLILVNNSSSIAAIRTSQNEDCFF
jgi:hypothetical protein